MDHFSSGGVYETCMHIYVLIMYIFRDTIVAAAVVNSREKFEWAGKNEVAESEKNGQMN